MAYALVFHKPIAGAINGGTSAAADSTGSTGLFGHSGFYSQFGGGTTPTDSKGNTWTNHTLKTSSTDFRSSCIHHAIPPVIVGSGHTFTNTTNSTNAYPVTQIAGFSGAETSAPFDQENGGFDSWPASTGPVVPTENGELILTGIAAGDTLGNPLTIDLGFTITDQETYNGSSNEGGAMAYKVQGTAASIEPTWDSAVETHENARTIASFKAAAGAGVIPTISYAGTPYSKTTGVSIGTVSPTLVSGDAATSYAKRSGSFPPGVSLNAGNGNLTGTPTNYGTYTAVVYGTNATGDGPDTTVVFNVAAPAAPTVSYSTPQQPVIGVAFTANASSSGYGTLAFAILPALPVGLSISSSTGAITGTPTCVSYANFLRMIQKVYTVTVTDGVGQTATFALTLGAVFKPTYRVTNADGNSDQIATEVPVLPGTDRGGSIRASSFATADIATSDFGSSSFG